LEPSCYALCEVASGDFDNRTVFFTPGGDAGSRFAKVCFLITTDMSSPISRFWLAFRNGIPILLGFLALVGLYGVSLFNYLLFHSLAEAFSIVIAIAVFAIFWNTRHLFPNGVLLVIGLGCLFAGLFDLIYIFAYPRFGVFPGTVGNIALQAKTVAQWYVSLSCVAAFLFLHRRINANWVALIYSLVAVLMLLSIFVWRNFPDSYVEGIGVTAFQRAGLVISSTAYLGAFLLLVGNRREFDERVFKFLAATLIVFFVQDTVSATAREIDDLAMTVAHLCQIVALFFVYKAFVEVGLRKPYDLLFREQQQNAEALERHQRFLEAVLENVHSAIIACDARGILTLFNRAAREYHGLPQEPLPASQWAEHYDLYHPDGKTLMRMEEVPLFRALQGERVDNVELMVLSANGPARTFVASGQPLIGRDGLSYGAVVAMHDITERKQAEEELKRVNETLERRAVQLRALASELTRTEQRERRRLAQVLHDCLQQTLVAAKMQVGLAHRKVHDAEAMSRVLRQIGELIDHAIAESRSLTVELSPPVLFDRGLVAGLEGLARRFLDQPQLPVSLDLSPVAEPADEGTRIFLFQAARELLFNTVKYAQAQSAEIRLTRLAADRLRLVVVDDGRGFDPALTRDYSTSGGFGLFTIRERLELIGGRLEVLSAPGAGTQMLIDVADHQGAHAPLPT